MRPRLRLRPLLRRQAIATGGSRCVVQQPMLGGDTEINKAELSYIATRFAPLLEPPKDDIGFPVMLQAYAMDHPSAMNLKWTMPWLYSLMTNYRIFMYVVMFSVLLYLADRLNSGYAQTLSRCHATLFYTMKTIMFYWYNERYSTNDAVAEIMRRSRCHQVAGLEAMYHCYIMQGLYIKLGQLVASLTHILPLEWCASMRPCLDAAHSMNLFRVRQQLMKPREEGGLDGHDEEMWSEFHTVPMKAASLAQVHYAETRERSPKPLAVKIKYWDVENQLTADICLIEMLVKVASKIFPAYDFNFLTEYFRSALTQELDFDQEAENGERFREMFADWVDVTAPKPYRQWCSRDILTMDWVNGFNVDDKERMFELGIDPSKVAKRMVEVMASSIFDHGCVHADPHPGNIFVEPLANHRSSDSITGQVGWRLQWLDHALYQNLSPSFQLTYARLWSGLGRQDYIAVESACQELGVENWKSLATMLTTHRRVHEYEQQQAVDGVSVTTLTEQDFFVPTYVDGRSSRLGMLEVLGQVPEEMLLLLKVNDLMRSVQTSLGLPVDYFTILGDAADRHLARHAAAACTEVAESQPARPWWRFWQSGGAAAAGGAPPPPPRPAPPPPAGVASADDIIAAPSQRLLPQTVKRPWHGSKDEQLKHLASMLPDRVPGTVATAFTEEGLERIRKGPPRLWERD